MGGSFCTFLSFHRENILIRLPFIKKHYLQFYNHIFTPCSLCIFWKQASVSSSHNRLCSLFTMKMSVYSDKIDSESETSAPGQLFILPKTIPFLTALQCYSSCNSLVNFTEFWHLHLHSWITGSHIVTQVGMKSYLTATSRSKEHRIRWPLKISYFLCRCRNITYPLNLPQVSIVFIFVNEALSVILRSIHSAINRTPSHLLKEIILVDDNSNNSKEHYFGINQFQNPIITEQT